MGREKEMGIGGAKGERYYEEVETVGRSFSEQSAF
jgi:hypothetical protein